MSRRAGAASDGRAELHDRPALRSAAALDDAAYSQLRVPKAVRRFAPCGASATLGLSSHANAGHSQYGVVP